MRKKIAKLFVWVMIKILIFTEKNYDKKNFTDCISKISNINIRSFELIKLKYLMRTSNNKINYNELKIDVKL